MKLFGFEIKRASTQVPVKKQKRSFHAANTGNLYSSWVTSQITADVDIKRDLKSIRNRSRDLMQNDDYAKRFKRMIKSNVVGNKGIKLQNRAKDPNGNLDKKANQQIEENWNKWCKKGNCDVTGKYSFTDLTKLAIGAIAEDGEVLIRKVKGYDNNFKFALQIIEADHLDETLNDPNRNIVMGIEFDKWQKPIFYHVLKTHPGSQELAHTNRKHERIPANQIIHLFLPIRISASRGIPWMHTAMTRMKMVNGYEEAELVGARVAASKGGFYTQNAEGDEYAGDTEIDGTPANEITPGEFEVLPAGWGFETYDPQHPNTAFKDFMKVVLRGIASGLDVSYNTLSNDLEGVNFSSLRSGVLEEREVWKELQSWLCEHLHDDVYADWLDMALLTATVKLPYTKLEKFNNPHWLPRGFAWVDPLKDTQSNILLNKEGLKTHSEIFAEMGKDIEEVYEQLKREKELRKKYEITTLGEAELIQILSTTKDSEESENA
ncbi:phage portal protein [Malaciobacter canalis]|uniref:Phage portal protein n=1 Tax=Malaciobacter canalis TaxID=1912871 RepID=A0ABX4LRX1_9BACT|nr:phage portal protein [Malaciobacter canalis]PHO10322.1 phage portal protein [Malaciobacter canalis]QEE32427.1 phage portal protein, lambda family [Malaciobacter canalis]